jgi:hypothetical protein
MKPEPVKSFAKSRQATHQLDRAFFSGNAWQTRLPENDLAGATPPEFGAYFLAELVESGKIVDEDLKLKLLQMAFNLASNAQQPVKRKALGGSLVDTRSGYYAMAFALELDRLSFNRGS